MEKEDLKKFVNGIFAKRGHPPVKKFASEFSDGSKFRNPKIYNTLFEI